MRKLHPNQVAYNEKQRQARIKRAKALLRLRKSMTTQQIATLEDISPQRVRKLLASVK